MIESIIKSSYQKICLNPALFIISRFAWIKPNHLTLIALLTGIMSGVAMFTQHIGWAVFLIITSGYFDTLDGSLARKMQADHHCPARGSVFDIVSDRVVEFAIILGLYSIAPETRGFATLLMLGSSYICVTTFLVVGIFSANQSEKSFHYSPGLMERAEAFGFFIAMLLLPQWFMWLAWTYSGLVLWTAVCRVAQFSKHYSGV